MSNKNIAQAKAAKRTARAKSKATAAAKAKATPKAIQQRKMRAVMSATGKVANFDAVIENAVMDAKRGKTPLSEFKNTTDLINGIKRAVSEVFKLYCYVTLADGLIKQGKIDTVLNVDLPVVSRLLINFDNRIGTLEFLNKTPESERQPGVIETEALDIGTSLTAVSEELYNTLVLLEGHSAVIESTITDLTTEVEGEEDLNKRRLKVLEAIAYKYLTDLINADNAAAQQAVQEQPAESVAEETQPTVAE